MPGLDQKGPEGMGPMTGGGRGNCRQNVAGQGRAGRAGGAGRGRHGRRRRDAMKNRSMKRGPGQRGMTGQLLGGTPEQQPSQQQEQDKE